ncbi:MAG: 3,8-cyclase [bacterium]|nr:3,8-cyclase [bacterium]
MGEVGLKDRFGRIISYLRVSVTDRCNLRCRYCMPPEGIELISHEEILRYEELTTILKIFVGLGLKRVRFTGGEPLVREGFVSFLKRVREKFPALGISLTTNGILLKKFREELSSIALDSLNISLDTLDPEKYRCITRLGKIEDVWEGIHAFLNGKTRLKLNVVAIKGFNDDEVLKFVELTKRFNLIVRFIEFMPVNTVVWKEGDFLSIVEIKEIIEKKYLLKECGYENGAGPAKYYTLPWGGKIGFIGAVSQHFCENCNRIRLTADGRLRTCLFGGPELDVKKLIRSGLREGEVSILIRDILQHKPKNRFEIAFKEDSYMSRIGG